MGLVSVGFVKGILDKCAEPIIKGMAKVSKDEWERFKINLDIVFFEYLKKSEEKYSKIKTLLYRTEPKYIYDFFEIPKLKKEPNIVIKADDINKITDISHFIIIEGIGGVGKSTLMKHLFLNQLSKKDLIPIFFELKDINNFKNECEISDLIFNKLVDLGSSLKKEYIEYALKSGCFLFLFDGYDEIVSDKKNVFIKQFETFCDRFSNNYFIISSRPYSEFIEFQRFTVLKTMSLNKNQAISLIEKLNFDKDIKSRFITKMKETLYNKHRSFASNPLLLNIMLMTFDNYADIPEKLHLFYSNAFETLYSRHDATKSGYKREMKSNLSYDSFKTIFSYLCFITYTQGNIEFSNEELVSTLEKIQNAIKKFEFKQEDYIYDLVNSICVLYKDGLNYKFVHRSFQEYFTAVFLKELTDDKMRDMGLKIIEKGYFEESESNVFNMLFDMSEKRFEKNILIPIIEQFEKDYNIDEYNNNYDFYFSNQISNICFETHFEISKSNEPILVISRTGRDLDNFRKFIFRYSWFYCERNEELNKNQDKKSEEIMEYLIKYKGYKVGADIGCKDIINDESLYEMVRTTWVGNRILTLSNLYETLKKNQEENVDLLNDLFI